MQEIETFKNLHKWFYDEVGFIWKSDLTRLGILDKWEVLTTTNNVFIGDCEDAALTIMNKCLYRGIKPSQLYIVRCATELCPKGHLFDHAVLALVIEDNWYFSDNRFPMHPACDLRSLIGYRLYDAVSIMNLRGEGKPKLIRVDV